MRRFALLALVLAGCTHDGGGQPGADGGPQPTDSPSPTPSPSVSPSPYTLPHCAPTDPRQTPTTVAVLPDEGEAPYLGVINRAQRTLRVMIYLMGRGGIIDALKAKASAGVDVRVILDGQTQKDVNQKYYDEMAAAGVHVAWSDAKFPYMHAKIILADDVAATVSTGNYSLQFSIERERNFVALVEDAADLADLTALFDADWEHREPPAAMTSCTRLLISPINSRARLIALIDSAQRTLDIESMQLADSDVRSAITRRIQAGVAVRAVLAPSSWITANADAATFLRSQGVTARWMDSPNVHVKALVVDGAAAYAGSENFSYTSLSKNREIGVIVTEAAAVKAILDTFNRDYAASTAFQ